MPKKLFLFGIILFAVSTPIHTEEWALRWKEFITPRFDFYKSNFGDSINQVKSKEKKYPLIYSDSNIIVYCLSSNNNFVFLKYQFYRDKLTQASLYFDLASKSYSNYFSSYEQIKKEITGFYGNPSGSLKVWNSLNTNLTDIKYIRSIWEMNKMNVDVTLQQIGFLNLSVNFVDLVLTHWAETNYRAQLEKQKQNSPPTTEYYDLTTK